MCGIYLITNLINNKKYVGQSIDIYRRWRQHKNPGRWTDISLYRAFKKYGIENFSFEILEECAPEDLDAKEQFYINKFDAFNKGYNETLGGFSNIIPKKLNEENVLEIIKLLKENTLSMADIGKIYHVNADTISDINLGKSRKQSNIEYPIRKVQPKIQYCQICGKIISNKSKTGLCLSCFQNWQSKKPDRNTLKDLIRIESFTSIGKMYEVTDNAVRKWCKSYNLPFRKKDIKTISDENWDLI